MVKAGKATMRIIQLSPLLLALSLLAAPVSAAEKDDTSKAKERIEKKAPIRYRSLPKKEREKIRKVRDKYQKLPPEQQRKLREKWKKQKKTPK